METMYDWISPRRLATLPQTMGRTSRRIHVRRSRRKQLALGFYRSVRRHRAFDPLMLLAPPRYLISKTAWRPIRLASAAVGDAVSTVWERTAAGGRAAWESIGSPWLLLTAPYRWWNALVEHADRVYQRDVGGDGSREAAAPRTPLAASSSWQDAPDCRKTTWAFAAITGVAGVILAFILQFAAPKSEAKTASTAAVAKTEKSTKPVRKEKPAAREKPAIVTAQAPTKKAPPSSWESLPPDPLHPLLEASAVPPKSEREPEPKQPEPPVEQSSEPMPIVAAAPKEEPVPPPRAEPDLALNMIAIRRERTRAVDEAPEQFVMHAGLASEDEPPRERDDWKRFAAVLAAGDSRRGPSWMERLHPLDRDRIQSDLDHPPPSSDIPEERGESAAEVRLEIEQRLPKDGAVGAPLSMELVVKNAGRAEIPRVRIDDLVSEPRDIVDVSPLGVVRDRTVQWSIGPLKPGDEQTLRVQSLPTAEGRVEAASRVRTFARVSFRTEIAGPKLSLEVVAPERLTVGEAAPIRFRIQNTGRAPAQQVVLRETLPAELHHRDGQRLDHELGTLAPGESREAQLTVTAASAGSAVHVAEILQDGRPAEKVERRVVIAQRASRDEPAPQPRPRPTRRPPVSRPAAEAGPAAIAPMPPPTELCVPFIDPRCILLR